MIAKWKQTVEIPLIRHRYRSKHGEILTVTGLSASEYGKSGIWVHYYIDMLDGHKSMELERFMQWASDIEVNDGN